MRFRFLLHCATLYSFWVSPSAQGESRGYVAAGGPDYPGLRDLEPQEAVLQHSPIPDKSATPC